MELSKKTLDMASMALNAKVAKMEKYDEGTSGNALKEEYLRALEEVNCKIAQLND